MLYPCEKFVFWYKNMQNGEKCWQGLDLPVPTTSIVQPYIKPAGRDRQIKFLPTFFAIFHRFIPKDISLVAIALDEFFMSDNFKIEKAALSLSCRRYLLYIKKKVRVHRLKKSSQMKGSIIYWSERGHGKILRSIFQRNSVIFVSIFTQNMHMKSGKIRIWFDKYIETTLI